MTDVIKELDDLPADTLEILGRLNRIFPMMRATEAGENPSIHDTRCHNRIGDLDIAYEPIELVEHVWVIRVTVWHYCDAYFVLELFPLSLKIRKLEHWQDQKVREKLLPLINQKLVLEDLSDV